jgi:two-component system CheB/CheR fusion protein
MTAPEDDRQFDSLLDYLQRTRGFDFKAYKRLGLMRRIQRRMQVVGVDGFGTYLDYLEVHPEEFPQLFNAILINVTAFFRDQPAWDSLAADVVPKVLATKKANEPLRVWSAGCASGEEAYTLAMVLSEALGRDDFCNRVKIYATDVDEDALNKARLATYRAPEVACIPTPLLSKYFERNGDRFTFDKDLRRCVIFGRHDLIQDAPISRIDLLVCRNTLMYFNAEAQARILARFHFALCPAGFLFLGRAEMLLTHSNTFTPVNLKRRIFAKVPKVSLRDHLLIMAQTGMEEAPENHLFNHVRLRDLSFDADPTPQIILDANGTLLMANEKARATFNLNPKDLGRPFQDLELSYRPAELRTHIGQAQAQRRTVELKGVSWMPPGGEARFIDVQIVPLIDIAGNVQGLKIRFEDVTGYKHLQAELQQSNQELETAYEEIQTSNEELQSTNEELETTNEELQSTNEELETMNEELQSSNEELRTMNDELHLRTEQLDQVNAFLESILTSLQSGVAVLKKDLQVQVWNGRSEDLWGLRSEEVQGKNFLNLDIGLPVEKLRQPIKASLSDDGAPTLVTVDAVNRRGRAIRCAVRCSPLVGHDKQVRGTILLMEELDGSRPESPYGH